MLLLFIKLYLIVIKYNLIILIYFNLFNLFILI